MFEIFEAYIRPQVELTDEQLRHVRSLGTAKKVRKRRLLLQEGEVCRHKIFVCKGLLATYLRKDDGTEYIMRFTPENSWVVDPESYNAQVPTKFNIETLEDSEVLLWTWENMNELFAAIPAFRAFSERLIQGSMKAHQDRILMNISSTSEEKYQDFITTFPDVFRRVPLHMVASYLGVSRETLSRIRHAQLKQP
ncbi:MAG: Crp/Fnr family transcriptional regulator [Bacteroidetes bacterium]|nr:Crp/Fnr family transcriptional regulator [Bacteroidota bacterium]